MKTATKIVSLLLALLMLAGALAACSLEGALRTASDLAELLEDGQNTESAQDAQITPKTPDTPTDAELPDEDGVYTGKEELALYIHVYGHLPSNFITKKQAQEAGWSGGSLEPYCPGKCIGGDRFGNREGKLPGAEGRFWTECDVNTLGAKSRGAERLVFSNDGLIYYTGDHYESFERLY